MARIFSRGAHDGAHYLFDESDLADFSDYVSETTIGYRSDTLGGVALDGVYAMILHGSGSTGFTEAHFLFNIKEMTFNATDGITGGTFTDMLSVAYNPVTQEEYVEHLIGGMSIDAKVLQNALTSGDNGDGATMFRTAFSGADRFDLSDHNDKAQGWKGADRLNGYAGNDRLWGDAGNDTLTGGDGKDVLYGGTGKDVLAANAGNDKLYGDAGKDNLAGGGGKDVLEGGAGNDVLDGGAGRDKLNGGSGADLFVFRGNFGSDQILDFQQARDKIDLHFLGIAALGALSLEETAQGHLISLDGGTILVRDTVLTETDFIFA